LGEGPLRLNSRHREFRAELPVETPSRLDDNRSKLSAPHRRPGPRTGACFHGCFRARSLAGQRLLRVRTLVYNREGRGPSAKHRETYATGRFWPEPLLQLNPHYKPGGSVLDLVRDQTLDPGCAAYFRDFQAGEGEPDQSLKLRRHQRAAIVKAAGGKSFVVTTGTGSGKSLCFFIPIVDSAIRARLAGEAPRTRAIVIYPMNALANSQMKELEKFLAPIAGIPAVTFARYTGQES
jgi:hypothetical protein